MPKLFPAHSIKTGNKDGKGGEFKDNRGLIKEIRYKNCNIRRDTSPQRQNLAGGQDCTIPLLFPSFA